MIGITFKIWPFQNFLERRRRVVRCDSYIIFSSLGKE
jgi:hypothetical protein